MPSELNLHSAVYILQAFGEYVHKLEEIMERKARCVHSMRAQLQPYLKSTPSSEHQHKQEEDNH